MPNPPDVHYWFAGDEMNAERMNEIKEQIDFLRNPPMVHVTRISTTQTLTGAAWSFINFDTVVNNYDPYNMWDVSDPDAVYATIAGWYVAQAQFSLNQTSTDARLILGVYRNGTAATDLEMRSDVQNFPGFGTNTWTKEFHVYMNEGDWVHLGVWFDGDATRTTTTGSVSDACRMRLRWCSK